MIVCMLPAYKSLFLQMTKVVLYESEIRRYKNKLNDLDKQTLQVEVSVSLKTNVDGLTMYVMISLVSDIYICQDSAMIIIQITGYIDRN